MVLLANWRVHLRAAFENFVGIRRNEREVLRSHLDTSDIFIARENFHLLRCRNVQHVNALSSFSRKTQKTFSRLNRGLRVTNHRMACPVACHSEVTTIRQTVFVLRVEGSAAFNGAKYRLNALIVLHQQIAG